MPAKKSVLASQLKWAQAQGVLADPKGYVNAYAANLFRPLSTAALVSFKSGGGNELSGVGTRPAKMSAPPLIFGPCRQLL
jgi:hypothetical protein